MAFDISDGIAGSNPMLRPGPNSAVDVGKGVRRLRVPIAEYTGWIQYQAGDDSQR